MGRAGEEEGEEEQEGKGEGSRRSEEQGGMENTF